MKKNPGTGCFFFYMAINHSMKKILKALSFDGIEVEAARHLASLKAIDPMKIFHKTIDYKIYNGDYEVPVRIYLPREKVTEDLPVFLFFHGGGWVTDCIDNYEENLCKTGIRDRTYCGVGRIQTGAGTSISNRFYGLLCSGQSHLYKSVYFKCESSTALH